MLTLKIHNLIIGYLSFYNNEFVFKYSKDFKNQNKYNKIIGFPNLNKIYKSKELFPFFVVRIPGLKQPVIKEIIEKENIDVNNKMELLKRFGYQCITNPYILE